MVIGKNMSIYYGTFKIESQENYVSWKIYIHVA